jgi:hypothetical protein
MGLARLIPLNGGVAARKTETPLNLNHNFESSGGINFAQFLNTVKNHQWLVAVAMVTTSKLVCYMGAPYN